jgi:hypothetical protein
MRLPVSLSPYPGPLDGWGPESGGGKWSWEARQRLQQFASPQGAPEGSVCSTWGRLCRPLPMRERYFWIISYLNQNHLYNDPEILNTLKMGRFMWLGQLKRVNETSPCKIWHSPTPKAQRASRHPEVVGYCRKRSLWCTRMENRSVEQKNIEHRTHKGL